MTSYELRFPPTRGRAVSSVFFRGDAITALHLAQRTGHASELLRDGRPLCAIELDDHSGYWVITSLAPAAGAAAVAAR